MINLRHGWRVIVFSALEGITDGRERWFLGESSAGRSK